MHATKNLRNYSFLLASILVITFSGLLMAALPGKGPSKTDQLVTISTSYGEIKILLFDKTPKHKENFLKLASEGFYDSTTFHRVMGQFMIQGGDPNSKDDNPNNDGLGGPGYTIPAEFDSTLYHKKGMLAAARQPDAVNPKKESSGSQFYIVQGRKVNANELNRMALYKGINYTDEQKKAYESLGGTPHLDGDYTVFGEVIAGLSVVDSIAAAKTNRSNRPLTDIHMTMSVEKVKKKKISKLYNYTYPEAKQD